MGMPVRTCFWFDGDALEAAETYVALIDNSGIEAQVGHTADGAPLLVNFNLNGVPYQGLNGGPVYALTPAASIQVTTPDQGETDRLWDALTADGGQESRCGWLVDRFGLSWQIVPAALPALVGGPDPKGAARATEAMLAMGRIVIADLEAAYAGSN